MTERILSFRIVFHKKKPLGGISVGELPSYRMYYAMGGGTFLFISLFLDHFFCYGHDEWAQQSRGNAQQTPSIQLWRAEWHCSNFFYWHSKPKILLPTVFRASMILEPRIHFHAFSPSSRERERRREEPIMKSIRADSL